MALCAEVVDLIGLHLLNDPLQVAAVLDRRSAVSGVDPARVDPGTGDRSGWC